MFGNVILTDASDPHTARGSGPPTRPTASFSSHSANLGEPEAAPLDPREHVNEVLVGDVRLVG